MQIHPIHHSGFLVETARCCYLFDYYKGALPPLSPEKPVIVFASHSHPDHYEPRIFPLLKESGVRHISAVLSSDIFPNRHPQDIPVLTVQPGRTYALPGGEVLDTLLSTDCGVAFVLTCGEGTLFHAGDLNDWSWPGDSDQDRAAMSRAFRAQIDKLRGTPVDEAFFPLDPRLREHTGDGLLYFLETVPRCRVWPMHYWSKPSAVYHFVEEHPEYASRIVLPPPLPGSKYDTQEVTPCHSK